MPVAGKCWRHSMINTRCSWLHADARGFRSKKHRLHSSGDYKHPPAKHEHAGLRKWMSKRAGPPVEIPSDCRRQIGQALVNFFREGEHRLLALAVGEKHSHALIELVDDMRVIRDVWGDAKRISSRAVKNQMPGSVWGAGGEHKRVVDRAHHQNTFDYILYEQGPGAWTWSFRDGSDEGVWGRKRPRRDAGRRCALPTP
jgi:REP element-mobilizing transposase RayT